VEDLSLWVVVALVSLDFLCFMSPIANAEPLASAMMEVTTKAGASLRIIASYWPFAWWDYLRKPRCKPHATTSCACPRLNARMREVFTVSARKNAGPKAGTGTTEEIPVTARMG
jgi:hypothetical protein